MDIPQVEAFLAVGTFGGFRRAAAALRLTQPAISARIRGLEDSLNVRLFERGRQGHGLALSAAGRALRPHAEQLLQAVALARQAVHDIRPASGGAIQIAAVLSICTYLLPDVLKRFQSAHKDVMITVRSGHSKEVLEMVLRGDAEIGLARSLHHPEIETVSLRDDPLVLVGRAASWPARSRRARPERGARGRDDRDREAHGRARDGAGVPPAPGGRPRATPAQPDGDRDRRRRADRAEPRRDPSPPAPALPGRARAPAGAAVGAQRGRRPAAAPALALPREQQAQERLALLAVPLPLADRPADQSTVTIDQEHRWRVGDLIA